MCGNFKKGTINNIKNYAHNFRAMQIHVYTRIDNEMKYRTSGQHESKHPTPGQNESTFLTPIPLRLYVLN